MTAEWFDLGQRLHAASTGQPAPRLTGAPLARASFPVAVRARQRRHGVTVTAALPGQAEASAAGAAALALLDQLGVTITAGAPRTLVIADTATLPALMTLAHSAATAGPQAATAAHLAWWAERADFPGSSGVADLIAACQARWVTGTAPAAERRVATWRAWLGIPGDDCAAMVALLDRVQDGAPLDLLDAIAEDDARSWSLAQHEHADQRDWARPDSVGRAAAGLASRCDAADIYQAALLTDPLYRLRAVHTGHVVTGTVAGPVAPRGPVTVICDRMDSRLRPGTAITGWTGAPGDTGQPRFAGQVIAATVESGALSLTVAAGAVHRPAAGRAVTLHPAAPAARLLKEGRRRYERLYGTRRSWLTTGTTPAPARRDVPLDVLVAAAGDSQPASHPGHPQS